MYCGVKLDRTNQGDALPGGEVLGDGIHEVCGVNADRDEDVQRRDLCNGYWDQTAVRIVDQEVATKRSCSVVVYAACAVGNVAHDQSRDARAELREDV